MTPRERLDLLRGYRAAGGTGSYVSLIKEAKEYATGGPKKKLPELKPYVHQPPASSSTKVVNPYINRPIELKNYYKEPPTLKADNATPAHRKVTKEYIDKVNNPTPLEIVGEGLQGLYRYTENPTKILGDVGEIISGITGKNNMLNRSFPNTKNNVLQSRRVRHNPFISDELRNKIQAEEFKNLTLGTLQNAALLELGYMSPQVASTAALQKTLEASSRANLAANVIQLYDTDWTQLLQLNPTEVQNFILNSAGVLAKTGGNFNTGDAITKLSQGRFLPTYKSLTRSDKINFFKDVTSHAENIISQGQRLNSTEL